MSSLNSAIVAEVEIFWKSGIFGKYERSILMVGHYSQFNSRISGSVLTTTTAENDPFLYEV